MKIFELRWIDKDETSWIAADTNIHALKVYCSITELDLHELEDNDEIVELEKEEWEKHFITDGDELPGKSFAQWMQENNRPDIIAESIYW